MKLTKERLKQIIREELEDALRLTAGGSPLDWRKGRHNPFSPDFWYGGSAVFPHDGPKVKPEHGWYDDKGGEVDLQSDDYADRVQQFTQWGWPGCMILSLMPSNIKKYFQKDKSLSPL